jgi:hypothetical protein
MHTRNLFSKDQLAGALHFIISGEKTLNLTM